MLKSQIYQYLHDMTDNFSVSQYLTKVLGSQHVPQGGLSQQTCGTIGIFHISDGHSCVMDSKVYHSIHSNSHTVFSQNLK